MTWDRVLNFDACDDYYVAVSCVEL